MATARTIDRPALSLVDNLPSAELVRREYTYQYGQRPWGAVKRTAEKLHCSRPYVDKCIEPLTQKQAKKQVKHVEREVIAEIVGEPDAYVPCPGEIEARENHAKLAAELAVVDVITPVEVQQCAAVHEVETVAVPHSLPLQFPQRAAVPVHDLPRVSKSTAQIFAADAEWTFCAILSIALVFTAAALVFATKSLGWSLVWLGFAMFCWWQTVGAWREWNNWRGPPRLIRTDDLEYTSQT